MTGWITPAYVGVLLGSIAFVVLFAPIVALQFRRYGRLSARRLVGAAALAIYGVALAAYTLAPLPSGDLAAWCAEFGVGSPQLAPLQFIDDIARETAGSSLSTAVRQPVVLQVVFNVLLFVPWGLFVRRYLGRGILVATASALLGSLLIEVAQGTGLFGLIGCAYRLADVDDLLMNTLGGLIGALLAPLMLRWMPQPAELERRRTDARPVTAVRRWSAMIIDAAAFTATGAVLVVVSRIVRVALGGAVPPETDAIEWMLGSAVPWLAVLLMPALVGSGASLGQRVVWLAVKWTPPGPGSAGARRRRAILRALAGGAGWGLLVSIGELPLARSDVESLTAVATGLAGLLAAVAVIAVPLTRNRRGLSLAATRGELVDVRSAPTPDDGPGDSRAPTPAAG